MSTLADIRSSVWGFSIAGFGVIAEGLAAIRQNIEIILKTTKGTDPLRPFFGSDLYLHIDKPVTKAVPLMKRAILEAVAEWETRVKIVSIDHSTTIAGVSFNINYILADKGLMDTLLLSIQNNQIVTGGQTGTLIVQGVIPVNPNSLRYLIDFVINGASVKPLQPVDGFATVNEMFGFIQNGWGTYGRWTLLNDRVVCYLDATDIKTVSLNISLSTSYSYRWTLPVIGMDEVYTLFFNANGKDVPQINAVLETPGQVIQALNDVWAQYGIWTLTPESAGYRLTLVSSTVKAAFLDIGNDFKGDFNTDFNTDFN